MRDRRKQAPRAPRRLAGIRADDATIARWRGRARLAGLSLNAWARLVLDGAPRVRPAGIAGARRPRRAPRKRAERG